MSNAGGGPSSSRAAWTALRCSIRFARNCSQRATSSTVSNSPPPPVSSLVEAGDPAADISKLRLQDGSVALLGRHGQLQPAFGNRTQDRVVQVHRGETHRELAHPLGGGVDHANRGRAGTDVAVGAA